MVLKDKESSIECVESRIKTRIESRGRYTQKRVALDMSGQQSMTKQSHAKECDINTILKNYKKTGLVDHININRGVYNQFIGVTDYHSALNAVIAAEEAFLSLPSGIRSKFDNDAGRFVKFVEDPNNEKALVEMGLAKAKVQDFEQAQGVKEDPPVAGS